MDFALTHIHEKSTATASNIRHIPVVVTDNNDSGTNDENKKEPSMEEILVEAANEAAANLLLGNNKGEEENGVNNSKHQELVDSASYPDRMTPASETISVGNLVVIFENFDSSNFCYAEKGKIFNNRNGHFHHDDFIGKPYGCKIRSRNNRGWGFVYLLKPTPELWSQSLNHRTQIIHFLDASMIVFYLNIRPNMVICESGTGSGALSHCIMRSIAPKGMLHTYEFNQQRAETAKLEFANNGVSHISEVHHKDVCGKHGPGGFDRPQSSVDAIVLDLPEPWSAVPYAAHCIKPNSRIVSYSPCVEQAQKTIIAMKTSGFHSIKTMEFRLKENYVDEMEYEMPPREKLKEIVDLRTYDNHTNYTKSDHDVDKGKQEQKNDTVIDGDDTNAVVKSGKGEETTEETIETSTGTSSDIEPASKKRKFLVARPFTVMRGHTAFLTFATSGNAPQPNPEESNC